MRITQHIRASQETVNVLQGAEEFKRPERATSEVRRQIFTRVSDQNHVFEA